MSCQRAHSIPHFLVIYPFVPVSRMPVMGLTIQMLKIWAGALRTLKENLGEWGKTPAHEITLKNSCNKIVTCTKLLCILLCFQSGMFTLWSSSETSIWNTATAIDIDDGIWHKHNYSLTTRYSDSPRCLSSGRTSKMCTQQMETTRWSCSYDPHAFLSHCLLLSLIVLCPNSFTGLPAWIAG